MNHFKVHERPHLIHLEFNQPSSGNALSLDVAREVSKIQKSLRKSRLPVIVSSGHPTLFCSGGNLSDYKKLKTKAAGLKINREIQKHLDHFGNWPTIKLALIEGDVLGGGMEWLARFDFRWSAPHVLYAFWQRRIGLSPGWGGGKAWADKIGEAQVRSLLINAQLLSAPQAMNLGLVDRVVSAWRLRQMVKQWAGHLDMATAGPVREWTCENETQLFSQLWLGPAHRAALAKWKKS